MKESKDSSTYDNATTIGDENILSIGGDNRIKTYNEALRDKKFITGEESDHFGYTADFTHFEFMLAAQSHKTVITEAMSVNHLQGLYAFWSEIWLYLGPLMKKFRAVSESYTSLIEDDSDLLTNMANMKIKLDLHEEYVEKHMTIVDRCAFNIWYKKEKAIIDDKLEKIRTDEGYRLELEANIKKAAHIGKKKRKKK